MKMNVSTAVEFECRARYFDPVKKAKGKFDPSVTARYAAQVNVWRKIKLLEARVVGGA